MKAILFVLMMMTSVTAYAGNDVFYCGGLGVEGSSVKVDPAAGTMCISYGPLGTDYCDRATETFTLKNVRKGTLNIDGRDFSYSEFLGVNEATGKTQWVRSYDESSNVSIALITVHRADLAGEVTLISPALPTKEAADGEPTCIRGEDGSF